MGEPATPGYVIGDALEELRKLPDEWAHCCVTSPPYWGLRDYDVEGQLGQEPTPDEYVAKLVAILEQVRRVLRSDGTLWLNLGDAYVRDGGRRLPGASANSWVTHTAREDGCAAGRYVAPSSIGLPQKNLLGLPWRVAFALQAAGWWLRLDIIWEKPNAMPESIADRPTKVHEYLFLLSKSESYHYDAAAVREPHTMKPQRRPHGHKRRRPGPLMAEHTWSGTARDEPGVDGHPDGRNKRSVWTVLTVPYLGPHRAVFPPKLITPCIMAGCPRGGIVLDPFFGSGTTGEVAEALGRRWFGIELNPKDEALIRERTAQVGLLPAAGGGGR